MTAAGWSPENVLHVLLPRCGTSPGRIYYTLHALPVDKWEVLLTYHSLFIIQCLCYLFSPELSDHIFGDPVACSPEISTDFCNGKILEINSFASIVAMSAAVASLSTWQFTHCAGDILASNRYSSAWPYKCYIHPPILEDAMRPFEYRQTSDCGCFSKIG
jgi:hypothetical protein